jgi:hypothetical protein
MYFQALLKDAVTQVHKKNLPEDITLQDGKKIHFVSGFKYLGSAITPLLNKDTEIKARIKKAKSIIRASRHFFDNKDADW